MTPWQLDITQMQNCNCDFGCPCQYTVKPTHGTCEASIVYEIHSGFYGDTDLSGTKAGFIAKWPGAIYEGNGEIQLVIDESTTEEQRKGIEAILSGKDTDEMATGWYIFNAMCPTKHETIYRKIDATINQEERIGSAKVEGMFDLNVKPLANPVSGMPHRAAMALPNGQDFLYAEVANGTTITKDSSILQLPNNTNTHSQLSRNKMNNHGMIKE
tara:strand:+ start:216 stop:857 length:642 start_codon:yes stop_codon:yes gene_type:complete